MPKEVFSPVLTVRPDALMKVSISFAPLTYYEEKLSCLVNSISVKEPFIIA